MLPTAGRDHGFCDSEGMCFSSFCFVSVQTAEYRNLLILVLFERMRLVGRKEGWLKWEGVCRGRCEGQFSSLWDQPTGCA